MAHRTGSERPDAREAVELLERVAQGDPGAVRGCLDCFGPLVWSLSRKFSGSPEETMVAWKPRARASMATNTPTVPAIPTTATSEDIQRSRALRTL